MDSITQSNLVNCGVNLDETLERFMGNEALLFKFLKKFIADENYEGLIKCLDNKEYEQAFNYAHTLKGVSANLGLGNVNASTQVIVERLRGQDHGDYTADVAKLKDDYEATIAMINQLP